MKEIFATELLIKILSDAGLSDTNISLFEHSVGVNWRQRNTTVLHKMYHLNEGMIQEKPKRVHETTIDKLAQSIDSIKHTLPDGDVLSFKSSLHLRGQEYHLPIMNLHPEQGVDYESMISLIHSVVGTMPGYVLKSGRYYHFYGEGLLSKDEWYRFLASWLMPTIIVSPRYIGHCLYRGYAALRLTHQSNFKPDTPKLVEALR